MAHSTPASAISKALVERYWLAEVRCSKIIPRLAKNATSVMLNSKINETASEAAPR
ncbi:MAG TPA: hypothetical protein VGJ65_22215 [Albitalea sp.]